MQLQSGASDAGAEWNRLTRAAMAPTGGRPAMSEQLAPTSVHTIPAPRSERGGDRLYMTGDLRALTGLPRTHIDFYLREGIIRPTLRTGSGYLTKAGAPTPAFRRVLGFSPNPADRAGNQT
jgi:hypothetical protein